MRYRNPNPEPRKQYDARITAEYLARTERAREMFRNGRSTAYIAIMVGVNQRTVQRYVKDMR